MAVSVGILTLLIGVSADSLQSTVNTEWTSDGFRGPFKCHLLHFCCLSQVRCLVKLVLAGKNVVASQISLPLFFLENYIPNSQESAPRMLPVSSFLSCLSASLLLMVSFSLFLLFIYRAIVLVAKNKLVCLSHSGHLPSGSSLSGTDVIRLRHECTVGEQEKSRESLTFHLQTSV